MTSRERMSKRLFLASMGAYAVSLALPAFTTLHSGQLQYRYGWEALLMGAFGVAVGQPAWLANPLLWGAWGTRRVRIVGLSLALSLLAFAVAMMFLAINALPSDAAAKVEFHASVGFFVWLASIALAATAALTYVPAVPGVEASQPVR